MTTCEEVVDFIAECYRNNWDLDCDDLSEILAGNFQYVRDANTIAVEDYQP